jgi:hypothetical protein
MTDEMTEDPESLQRESEPNDQTIRWNLVATLVVPVRLREDAIAWPPSDM